MHVFILNFILKLVEGVNDVKIREILDVYDFYILPVVNPDGYEYTHTTV